jgi:hypothetical protein
MAAGLQYEWDSRDLAVWRGGAMETAVSRALRLAGNQAIRALNKDEIALARSKKSLPEKIIAEDQSLSLPGRSVEIKDMAWRIYVRGKPVPAAKFPHTTSGLGTIVTFGGAGGTKLISGAFVARMKSGHLGIYRRKGKTRLPIDEVFSSRLPKQFGQEVVLTLGDKTYRKLATAYERGLKREIGKLKRKGEA